VKHQKIALEKEKNIVAVEKILEEFNDDLILLGIYFKIY
jgi:hypothetical protein